VRIGELLLDADAIDAEQLEAALRAQRRSGGLLGQHLLRQQAISEPALHYHLGLQRSLRLREQRRFSRLGPLRDLLARFVALSPGAALSSIGLVFLGTAVRLTLPCYLKLVFDQRGADLGGLLALGAGMLVLQILGQVALAQGALAFQVANTRFANDLQRQMYRVVQHLPFDTAAQRSAGQWLTHLTADVDAVSERWEHLFLTLFRNLSAIAVASLLLAALDPLLTGLVLSLSVLTVLLTGQVSNLANPWLMRRPRLIGDLVALLREKIAGARAVKAFNALPPARRELGRRLDVYYRNDFRMVRPWNIAFNLRVALGALLSGLLLYAGGSRVIEGRYSAGSLMMAVLVAGMLAPYVDELMPVIIKSNDVKRYWRRCADVLAYNVDTARSAVDAGRAAPPLEGSLALEGLTFSYGERRIFDRLDLRFAPNRCYAVVGRSGAGKSTLLRLLQKELEPGGGRILLGGRPLDQLSDHAVSRSISYVAQRPAIFPGSAAHNIALGGLMFLPEVTQPAIEAAARRACIHERILALPAGYATPIGDGGHPLSGGERQRISIARALMKSPTVCLFDEPTSALDPDGERMVLDTLLALRGQCTVLVATHNLALLDRVDELLILDGPATRFVRPEAVDRARLLHDLYGAEVERSAAAGPEAA
jgi:ATP-binding cassette subfamily B protein